MTISEAIRAYGHACGTRKDMAHIAELMYAAADELERLANDCCRREQPEAPVQPETKAAG